MNAFSILAQNAEAPIPAWGQLGVSGVMLALFAWLVTKGHPDMIAKFTSALETSRAECDAAHKSAREEFTTAIKEGQAWHERQVERCIAHCESERKIYHDAVRKVPVGKRGSEECEP